ncbi:hypothetical protein TVAG_316250 [Trichomonas vaginalis G3]|uniref:Uncharacterized protein n=1 Tax=Trichomonas vaginalis (strain ATCC PRA-98 / G3) TaxID=412133 RepID=A2FAY3_TRIV3|nr:hypothetical protein TVAGG3_0888520 [Trichomonas vaginalis G3]EAX97960.1 hypothetical protein TVAG_316250 [Trichomonas vaginalis G3]KAI5502557.1 hypothetical protein TVAGG3_0888520 [Trichomonas vaginalis G3]|eukprot:XP_001310890.1 hypothetical protein [Trichomonas vaginalis G3]
MYDGKTVWYPENIDEKRQYCTTSYRHDVAHWGGRTFQMNESETVNVDVNKVATQKRSIMRQVQDLNEFGSTVTPESTQRAHYVAHMPTTRGLNEPQFNGRVPPEMPLPEAPDPKFFTAATEYRDKYRGKPGKPMLNNDTLDFCASTRVMTRGIEDPEQPPLWETTYRKDYCNKVGNLETSPAITSHTLGNPR